MADGVAEGAAPGFRAKGVDVLVLADADELSEDLRVVGESFGDLGADIAAKDGGDEARQGRGEVIGGEIFAGEVEGDFAGEVSGGLRASEFAGVKGAEMGVAGSAGSAALGAMALVGAFAVIECKVRIEVALSPVLLEGFLDLVEVGAGNPRSPASPTDVLQLLGQG